MPGRDGAGFTIFALAVGIALIVVGVLAVGMFGGWNWMPGGDVASKTATAVGTGTTPQAEEPPTTVVPDPVPSTGGGGTWRSNLRRHRRWRRPRSRCLRHRRPWRLQRRPGRRRSGLPATAPSPEAPSPVTPASRGAGGRGAAGLEAANQSGRLLIRSTPSGALVLIDGEARGETPLAVRGLALGTHSITVTPGVGPRWERQVTLTAERPSASFEIGADEDWPAATAKVDPGVLEINSRPSGARVWMDGALVGTTPLMLSDVNGGSHSVRIEMPGYRPWTTAIAVAPGARARVAASLEQ